MTRNSLRHGITINTIKSFFEQEIEARASVQEITARNAFNRLGSYSQQSISLFVGHLICVFVLLGFIGTHSICLFSFVWWSLVLFILLWSHLASAFHSVFFLCCAQMEGEMGFEPEVLSLFARICLHEMEAARNAFNLVASSFMGAFAWWRWLWIRNSMSRVRTYLAWIGVSLHWIAAASKAKRERLLLLMKKRQKCGFVHQLDKENRSELGTTKNQKK